MLESQLALMPPIKVLEAKGNYIPIDFSIGNKALANLNIAEDFEEYVETHLAKNNAAVAFGGYNEERNLYKRHAIFKNSATEERNIHIGMDLWINAGTPVLAALDGEIHSFGHNSGIGNYGPTIILEHKINEFTFYTLYGHLSIESLENLEIGDEFQAGEKLATLGNASVNGNYAPHLHFQIIKDIGNHFSDYPGVCSKSDLNYYLQNCPDPNLLLKLNQP